MNKVLILFLTLITITVSLLTQGVKRDVAKIDYWEIVFEEIMDYTLFNAKKEYLEEMSNDADLGNIELKMISFGLDRHTEKEVKEIKKELKKEMKDLRKLYTKNDDLSKSYIEGFEMGMYELIDEFANDKDFEEEILKNTILRDKFQENLNIRNKVGLISGIKNGAVIGISYPAQVKNIFYKHNNKGEFILFSFLKGYFFGIFEYLNVSKTYFLIGNLTYKLGYIITWLITGYLNLIVILFPLLLIAPANKDNE